MLPFRSCAGRQVGLGEGWQGSRKHSSVHFPSSSSAPGQASLSDHGTLSTALQTASNDPPEIVHTALPLDSPCPRTLTPPSLP